MSPMLNTLNSQISARRGSKLSEFSNSQVLQNTGLGATKNLTRNALNSQTLPATMGVTNNDRTPKGAFTARNSMISKKRISKQSLTSGPKNTAENVGDI
jgi:hypothetical protein